MQRRNILAALGVSALLPRRAHGAPAYADSPTGATGWQNWSKSLPASTANIATPQSPDELIRLIGTTPGALRPVGSGHSWMPLVPTDGVAKGAAKGTIVKLDYFAALGPIDKTENTAWLGAGGRLRDLSPVLAEQGLAFRNLGDIDVQTLAGATATATHGTGKTLPCLAAEIRAVKMVTGAGQALTISQSDNANLLQAVQVALGVLGVLTEIEMQLVPRYKLHRRVYFAPHRQVLADAQSLWDTHRNFEFFYLPFSDTSMCITHNVTERADTPRAGDESESGVMQLKALRDYLGWFPALRKRLLGWAIANAPEENVIGESWQLLPSTRNVAFNEMEYHLPPNEGLEALEEIRLLVEREQPDVFFPFECRMTASDEAWLSPFNEGSRLSVAVHAHAPDAYDFLFTKIEPIFRRRGGRPHWGKLNSLGRDDLRTLYPKFDAFTKLRAELDPKGRLLNPYLRDIFGGRA